MPQLFPSQAAAPSALHLHARSGSHSCLLFVESFTNKSLESAQLLVNGLLTALLTLLTQYVERARTWAERLGCSKDVQFVLTNATISMATMLSSYSGENDLSV